MCRVKARVKGKNRILQSLGYRGKREAKTPLGDARQARMFIVPKSQAGGLRVGSTVTVTIAGRRIKCRVKRWSRGAKLLVPTKEYPLRDIPASRLRRVLVD